MSDSTKTEKVPATTGNGVVDVNDEGYQAVLAAIMGDAPLPGTDDPELRSATSRRILQQIADADSVESVLAEQSLDAWRDLKGVPCEVVSVRFNPATVDRKDGSPYCYAVVDVIVLTDGEETTVTCGGQNVMMQLARLWQLGQIPGARVKLEGKRIESGNEVLRLAAV